MDELIQALDGWDDLDAQERSRRNKEIGNNRAYKMCKKFCVLDIAGERALVDLVHAPGDTTSLSLGADHPPDLVIGHTNYTGNIDYSG